MPFIFSLTDASLNLPFKSDESLNSARRVISVDTLTGRESRDLGSYASDTNIDIETTLTASEFNILSTACGKGEKVGLSFSLNGYEGFIQKVSSLNSTSEKHLVKIVFITTGEL